MNFHFYGARNLFIISLMLDCGLRLSELTKLCLSDFSEEKRTILINGKGQKQRLVPFSDYTLHYFKIYKDKLFEKVSLNSSEQLLLDKNLKPLSSNAIKLIIKRLKKKLDFPHLHPHLFRHTFATVFLLNGGDPLHLQIILGHTTLTMTSKYVHVANAMSIAKQRQYSPLSNL